MIMATPMDVDGPPSANVDPESNGTEDEGEICPDVPLVNGHSCIGQSFGKLDAVESDFVNNTLVDEKEPNPGESRPITNDQKKIISQLTEAVATNPPCHESETDVCEMSPALECSLVNGTAGLDADKSDSRGEDLQSETLGDGSKTEIKIENGPDEQTGESSSATEKYKVPPEGSNGEETLEAPQVGEGNIEIKEESEPIPGEEDDPPEDGADIPFAADMAPLVGRSLLAEENVPKEEEASFCVLGSPAMPSSGLEVSDTASAVVVPGELNCDIDDQNLPMESSHADDVKENCDTPRIRDLSEILGTRPTASEDLISFEASENLSKGTLDLLPAATLETKLEAKLGLFEPETGADDLQESLKVEGMPENSEEPLNKGSPGEPAQNEVHVAEDNVLDDVPQISGAITGGDCPPEISKTETDEGEVNKAGAFCESTEMETDSGKVNDSSCLDPLREEALPKILGKRLADNSDEEPASKRLQLDEEAAFTESPNQIPCSANVDNPAKEVQISQDAVMEASGPIEKSVATEAAHSDNVPDGNQEVGLPTALEKLPAEPLPSVTQEPVVERSTRTEHIMTTFDDEDEDDPGPLSDAVSETDNLDSGDSQAPSDPTLPSPMPALNRLRKGSLTTITKTDLEELMVQKICECVADRCEVGELRRRSQALELAVEKWKERAIANAKQMRELKLVIQKFNADAQKQFDDNSQMVVPVRVTRSVGLQVSIGNKSDKSQTSHQTASKPSKPNHSTPATAPAIKEKRSEKPPPSPIQKHAIATKSTKPGRPKAPVILKPVASKPATTKVIISKSANPKAAPSKPANPRALTPKLTPKPPTVAKKSTTAKLSPIIAKVVPPPPLTPAPTSSKTADVIDIDLTDDEEVPSSQFQISPRPSTAKSITSPNINSSPGKVLQVLTPVGHPQNQGNNRVAYLVPANQLNARQVSVTTSRAQTQPTPPPLVFNRPSQPQQQPQQQYRVTSPAPRQPLPSQASSNWPLRHPAPLPNPPANQPHETNWKLRPPRPTLKISIVASGIVLSWDMTMTPEHETIASYQLVAYQEGLAPPSSSLWKRVGDVKALPLPMACTLTQFVPGHKYHFAVRAVDIHMRVGQFSYPGTILLVK